MHPSRRSAANFNHRFLAATWVIAAVTPYKMAKRLTTKRSTVKSKQPTFPDIDDANLGTLVFSSQYGPSSLAYHGTVHIRGKKLDIILCSDDVNMMKETQKYARKHVRGNIRLLKQARGYVSDKFVPKYNRELRKQHKLGLDPKDWPLLEESAFLKTLDLQRIVFSSNGDSSYWFDVGDQLQGHGFVLYYTIKKGFHQSDTPG